MKAQIYQGLRTVMMLILILLFCCRNNIIAQNFSLTMPIRSTDTASIAYGIWSFGVHGSGHAFDGHPGWDIEYRVGASVIAPAAGTILNIAADIENPQFFTVRMEHRVGSLAYNTDYTNISALAPGIAKGVALLAGQPIGTAGTRTQTVGNSTITFAMTHFQLNDQAFAGGKSNFSAISPYSYLNAEGKKLFDAIWKNSAYYGEFCEPYHTNARDTTFPLTRIWTLKQGTGIARIDLTRLTASNNDYQYQFFNIGSTVVESGAIVIVQTKPPGMINFVPTNGGQRQALYNIINDTLWLALGEPGGTRPNTLTGASVYTTNLPLNLWTSLGTTTFCPGMVSSAPFYGVGKFASDNIFRMQLSDADGSFGSPLLLGILTTSDAADVIQFNIPENLSSSTRYRVRLTSSNPVVIGPDNGVNIAIQRPTPIISGSRLINQRRNEIYSVNQSTGSRYIWSVTGGTIVSGQSTNPTISVSWSQVGRGSVQVIETNNAGCKGITRLDVDVAVSVRDKLLSENTFSALPNPASDIVDVHFMLAKPERVSLKLFNALGQEVAQILDGILPAGEHRRSLDIGDWSLVSQTLFVQFITQHSTCRTIPLRVMR